MNGRDAARAIDALRRGWAIRLTAPDGAIRLMGVTMSVWKTIRITCYAKRFLTVSERLSRMATAAKAKAAIGI